jgi:hypothetical protein
MEILFLLEQNAANKNTVKDRRTGSTNLALLIEGTERYT